MSAQPCIYLAPDPVLPQRDLLLDTGEVARRLSRQLGSRGPIQIDRCERLQTKYSPGEFLRVLHRIEVGACSYTIAARAFAKGRSKSAFERAMKTAVPCGNLLPVARDVELDTVYWTFPNDRRITNLSALANPPRSLASFCGNKWTQSRVVAYASEKCVTAECLSDQSELLAYVKIYSDDEQPSYSIYNALSRSILFARSNLRIPRALAYSNEHRALLLEPIAGRPIASLENVERRNGFRCLGVALAALHSIPVPDDLPTFKRLDSGHLREAAQTIARARPDLAALAGNLAQELCERRDALTDSEVCLHTDTHPKNGILQHGSVALVDLDRAARGDAAADLGSLLAALRYSGRVGFLSPEGESQLGGALLSGYGESRELPRRSSLRWHMAAALLAERALCAVSRIRAEGLKHMHELLQESLRLLTKGRYS